MIAPIRPRQVVAVLVVALLVALAAPAGAAPASVRPATTTIGAPPAIPAGAVLQGSEPSTTPVEVTLALQPSDPAGLAALASSVSTPGSPDYHRYLTTAQFAQRFGASPGTLQAVLSAAGGMGLTGGRVAANHLAVSFPTTAGAAAAAFAVPLRTAILPDGRRARVNTAAPTLPAAIAPAIQAVVGLDDLPRAVPSLVPAATRTQAGPAAQPQATGPQACTTAANAASHLGAYLPSQLASAYGLTGMYGAGSLGSGQAIALFELSTYSSGDVAAYQSCFGTSATVTNKLVSGGTTDSSGDIEVELDIEDVIGLAPQAHVLVYEGPNGSGIYSTYAQIANDNLAKVVSSSWTSCEPAMSAQEASAENTVFQQMATQGQTVLAASGDEGSAACYGDTSVAGQTQLAVNDPASQPYVTGVGATSLLNPASSPTESVWNNASGGSGGGLSTFWSAPSWQTGSGVSNSFSNGKREVPDVATSGDPDHGYLIYYTGANSPNSPGWQAIGGTSAGAPLWAALVALMNQTCASTLGFLNPTLYTSAGTGSYRDVTSGNNDWLGDHTGDYPATSGYDLATGLGSPIATTSSNGGLIAQFCPALPAFTADSPPATATTGVAYSYTFAASGRPAPTFGVASGTLPPGLSLNATTGVLSGTPAAGGPYTFTVSANGSGTAVTPSLTITVSQPPAFTAESPPGTAAPGVGYSYQFAAGGYPAPTFSVASGAVPAGLTLSSGSGILSGSPTATTTVSYSFTVSASNGVGSPASTPTLTIVVSPAQAPAFTADSPPSAGTVGTAYSYSFAASGNPSPTFSVTSGSLPPGLSLGATSGILSGTPSGPGSFTFTVSASNGVSPAASQPLSITVSQAPALTAASPPGSATVGATYGYTFAASGSPAPTFAVASGALPPGLSLDGPSGILAGTPTAAGTYAFTVSATNGVGNPAVSGSLSIAVSQAPAFTADAPPATGVVGHTYLYQLAASGSPAPTFAVASGSLPPGVILDGPSGYLDGFPTAAGTFSFTVSASNGVGSPAVTPLITITIALPGRTGKGYWEVASDGGLFSYGDATFYGSTGSITLNKPIVGMSATPDDHGYWEVASDGGLFSYGDATFFGSMGGKPLNHPIIGMVATPDGKGYWEVASDGGLFAFGNAVFYGSTGGMTLSHPIIGMVATPDGLGYWEVASDGSVYSYGDATFYGSMGGKPLNKPIVAIVATPDGKGYWEVASDGGLFSFGDAVFYGSTGGMRINKPIVGMVATPDGRGYWEVASDGGLFSYGDATFFGSAGAITLNKPIVGMFGT